MKKDYFLDSKNALLERIANHAMLNAGFSADLGLFNGKVGVVIFFMHYARYVQNSLYEEFAGELLDEIVSEIHFDLPLNFAEGLCGIGWAIQYLIDEKFIDGDANEILFEIDRKVLELNLLQMQDKSIEKGLWGVISYLRARNTISDSTSVQPFSDYSVLSYEQVFQNILKRHQREDTLILASIGLQDGLTGQGLKNLLL